VQIARPLIALLIAVSFYFPAIKGAILQTEVPRFELNGRILLPDGEIAPSIRPQVFLQSTRTIFYDQTVASRGWTFRFRGLEAGKYTLYVVAQGFGSSKQTLVVGKSQADSEGRIQIDVTLMAESADSAEVSAVLLAIPKDAKSEYQKALKSLSKQDRQGAIRHLERAVEIAPHYSDAWNRLGTISFKAQEYKQAEQYFREAIEQDPSSYPPLVNLGAALLLQNRLEDALSVNREAIERQPDDPLAHSQLGGTYFALGQLDKSEFHFKTAKSKDEAHFSNPQLMLAKIYLQRKEYSAAIEELEGFLRIHPDYHLSDRLKQLISKAREELATAAERTVPQ
jgi:tetratricopeptide (TPR) repeat protein